MADSPQKVSLSVAAYAADVVWSRLRNWLDKEQINLDADNERGDTSKHRRFTALDVFKIAIMGRLVQYGVTPETANDLADLYFKKYDAKQRAYMRDPKNDSLMTNQLLAVWFIEEGKKIAHLMFYEADLESMVEKIRKDSRGAFLIVDLGGLADTALERLNEEI